MAKSKAVRWHRIGQFEFSIQGKQPGLSYNHYEGWNMAKGFWWHCWRMPSNKWLWLRRHEKGYAALKFGF